MKITNPNDMYFRATFNSYFNDANLDAYLGIGPLSDSFEPMYITTSCEYKQ